MADRTIKPDDTNDLVLQNNDGSAKLELNEDQTVKVTTGSASGDDFTVNSTQLMVSGDTGNVGVGVDPASNRLAVKALDNTIQNNHLVDFRNEEATAGDNYGLFIKAGSNSSDYALLVQDKSANERFKVGGDGTVTVSTGDLKIGTAGKGIDFSVNSNPAGMTSELLDDYEEGTWSPTINASGYGSATRTGYYRKIGSLVQISGTIENWDHTDNTNNVTVESLPFTANANNNFASGVCSTNQSNFQPSHCTVVNSTTTMVFHKNSTGNNNRSTMMFNTVYNNTDRALYWNAFYYTDS